MHYNFCTLFDKNYLYRGLALHQSLIKHCPDFVLYILCLDEETHRILTQLKLEQVKLIRLAEFEDAELLKIKPSRSAAEYCWTLTPSLPLYILKKYPKLEHITYLDADLFFFADPAPLYKEFDHKSILIVKHNYGRRLAEKASTAGLYNVEFLIFRNDPEAIRCLTWWRERCNEWCYNRQENGKFGDQMYLNDWPTLFKGVAVLTHLGGGIAPWNLEKYRFSINSELQVLVNDQPVIFQHFHALKLYAAGRFDPFSGYWWFPPMVKQNLFAPYYTALKNAQATVKKIMPDFSAGITTVHKMNYLLRQSLLKIINLPPFKWLYALTQFSAVRNNLFISIFCLISFIFLLCANQWFWPTPDEYFYGTISHAFSAASQGQMRWSDINTEHTSLVPFICFIYNSIFHPTTLTEERIPIFFFALGIIILIYLLAKEIKLSPVRRIWFLCLLLLIPGFWIFSVRLMLDIPAAFCIILLVYLLVKKSPDYLLSIGLVLLLITKEYYIYLLLPLTLMIKFFDIIFNRKKIWKKILILFKTFSILTVPVLITIFLFIDFNFLPYPRLLDNSLQFIAGNYFNQTNKVFLQGLNTLAPRFAFLHVDNNTNTITETIETNGEITAPHTIPVIENIIESKIADIPEASSKPVGIFESHTSVADFESLAKLWLIYKYNFSDLDLNILLLPLFIIGIGLRGLFIIQTIKRKKYAAVRTDLVVLSFTGIFIYFNYHEAAGQHGFRITLPLIFSIIYYSYYTLVAILFHFSIKKACFIAGSTGFFLYLFWLTIKDYTYGSVIAQNGIMNFLASNKIYIIIIMYLVIVGYILIFHKLKNSVKYVILALIFLVLFLFKFIPNYLDSQSSTVYYGDNYNINDMRPYLKSYAKNNYNIYSNFHSYKIQYLAHDPRIYFEASNHMIRQFSRTYFQHYFRFSIDDSFISNLKNMQIKYICIINDDYFEKDWLAFSASVAENPDLFQKVQDSYQGTRLQWAIYEFKNY